MSRPFRLEDFFAVPPRAFTRPPATPLPNPPVALHFSSGFDLYRIANHWSGIGFS